jgi:hypothetical protein
MLQEDKHILDQPLPPRRDQPMLEVEGPIIGFKTKIEKVHSASRRLR